VDVLITLFPCVTFFMSTTTGTHVNFQELWVANASIVLCSMKLTDTTLQSQPVRKI
jgi:hypothetical protein